MASFPEHQLTPTNYLALYKVVLVKFHLGILQDSPQAVIQGISASFKRLDNEQRLATNPSKPRNPHQRDPVVYPATPIGHTASETSFLPVPLSITSIPGPTVTATTARIAFKMDPNAPNTPLDIPASTTVRPGGAPARVYLNEKIVPHLLEGMKTVAKDQPPNPLRVLGEYLIQKSEELEEPKKEGE